MTFQVSTLALLLETWVSGNISLYWLFLFVCLFPEIISGQTWGFESCPKPSSLSRPYADPCLDLLKYPEVLGCLNNFPLAIWNSELIRSLSRKTPVIYALPTSSSILVIGKTKKSSSSWETWTFRCCILIQMRCGAGVSERDNLTYYGRLVWTTGWTGTPDTYSLIRYSSVWILINFSYKK